MEHLLIVLTAVLLLVTARASDIPLQAQAGHRNTGEINTSNAPGPQGILWKVIRIQISQPSNYCHEVITAMKKLSLGSRG